MKTNLDNLSLDKLFPFVMFDYFYPPNSQQMKEHYHNYIEITLVRSGSFIYEVNGITKTNYEGDVIIINALEQHKAFTSADSSNVFVIGFYPEITMFTANKLDYAYIENFISGDYNFENYASKKLDYTQNISQIIYQLYQEYTLRADGWQLMIKAKLLELLTHLYRNHKLKKAASEIAKSKRLKDVLEYINSNFSSNITLENCAKECGLSKEYFCKHFKKSFGINFSDYLATVRINNFIKKYLSDNANIAEIASKCGYKNYSSFNEAFKRITGTTPHKYKK